MKRSQSSHPLPTAAAIAQQAVSSVVTEVRECDVADAAVFLTSVLAGMGDTVDGYIGADRRSATVRQHGLRIVRGMTGDDRDIMLSCWTELWRGAVSSHRQFIDVWVEARDDALTWHLALKGEQ